MKAAAPQPARSAPRPAATRPQARSGGGGFTFDLEGGHDDQDGDYRRAS